MFNINSKSSEGNNAFCTLPFIHLATHPIGTVTPCCITDMKDGASTAKKADGINLFLNNDKLEDITNSKLFNTIRKQMINNEYPNVCKACYKYENDGVDSRRLQSNLKFKDLIDDSYANINDDGSLKKLDYRYIELRLGTICNLKCITCNPFSSNRWNEDVGIFKDTEFQPNYFKNDVKNEWYRDSNFYDELFDKCTNLEEIWINGGEPTLIREHGYFLNKLIESGRAKNIDLHYSINATNIPDEFIEIWKKFKSTKLQLSVDDLYERNDYIRTGSKWKNIHENILKMTNYRNIFRIEVCQTISALNAHNVDNFKNYVLGLNLITAHNFVHHPSFLHVSHMPKELKKEILGNIKYLTNEEYKRFESEVNTESSIENFERFRTFISMLDNKRKVFIGDYLLEWKPYF
jgi:hypothetical protein